MSGTSELSGRQESGKKSAEAGEIAGNKTPDAQLSLSGALEGTQLLFRSDRGGDCRRDALNHLDRGVRGARDKRGADVEAAFGQRKRRVYAVACGIGHILDRRADRSEKV